MRLLARYLATWTDGRELVLHCRTLESAYELARRLKAPAGVWVRSVASLES